jgi:hypothetical protein
MLAKCIWERGIMQQSSVVNIVNGRVNKKFDMFTNLPIFILLGLLDVSKFVNYFSLFGI